MLLSQFLIEKYSRYVSNIEWHIQTNKPKGSDLEILKKRLECYKEILEDLKSFSLYEPIKIDNQTSFNQNTNKESCTR